MLNWVELATLPPSTATGPPQVSPTPMALPALPPLLTSPIATAPPLAEAVATPPLPAEAVSVNCISLHPPCGPPRSPSTLIRALPGSKPVRRARSPRDAARRVHRADRQAPVRGTQHVDG